MCRLPLPGAAGEVRSTVGGPRAVPALNPHCRAAKEANAPATSAVNHMKASDRFSPLGTLAALIVSTMLTMPHPAAAQANTTLAIGRLLSGRVTPLHTCRTSTLARVCTAPAAEHGGLSDDHCGVLSRQLRLKPSRTSGAPPAAPWGYVRRLPPSTPEGRIQPLYRGASTIRPGFSERDGRHPTKKSASQGRCANPRYLTTTAVPTLDEPTGSATRPFEQTFLRNVGHVLEVANRDHAAVGPTPFDKVGRPTIGGPVEHGQHLPFVTNHTGVRCQSTARS